MTPTKDANGNARWTKNIAGAVIIAVVVGVLSAAATAWATTSINRERIAQNTRRITALEEWVKDNAAANQVIQKDLTRALTLLEGMQANRKP